MFPEDFRVLSTVNITDQDVLFDFRYVGDDYFDSNWQLDILEGSQLVRSSFYAPNETDYFYSLLYHGLLHKSVLSSDYIDKLHKIAEFHNIGFNKYNSREQMLELLSHFMFMRGYNVTFPQDASVAFNFANASRLNNVLV